jgi:hypothetical protein
MAATQNDPDTVTPVHIDRERDNGKYEVYEQREGTRRVLAWGFSTVDGARRWVTNHNALSGFSELQLVD